MTSMSKENINKNIPWISFKLYKTNIKSIIPVDKIIISNYKGFELKSIRSQLI